MFVPRAGTGLFGEQGLQCLRALTIVLLEFYDACSTVSILAVLIPQVFD